MSEEREDPTEESGRGRGGRRGRATRPRHPNRPCLNCGDPTPGEYCPTCGQRKVDVQVSVRTMLADVLEDQLLLGHRLPRTLGALLFRPGLLTAEHVNGRIVRYISPFKLYLATSIVFFLLLTIFGLRLVDRAEIRSVPGTAADSAALAQIDSLLADTLTSPELRASLETGRDTVTARLEQADSLVEEARRERREWARNANVNTGFEAVDAVVRRRLQTLADLEPQEIFRTLLGDFLSYVPTAMFILLPLFGLALKLAYVRQGRYYAEHFVFLLHVHSFVFIVFTLLLLVAQVDPVSGLAAPVLLIWAAAYILLALKRVYAQRWPITVVKWFFLWWVYFYMVLASIPVLIVATLILV